MARQMKRWAILVDGLGLAVVKAVARMHGGIVSETSVDDVNTIGFNVVPAARPDSIQEAA
ncbi:hypothetical protein [Variovorax sp. LG9.2]|uniref:hypothetical protein n=1 Tax=Variovorax sp. LG9.2 TaxID=3048626 RepID=UPI002B22C430|nr:hypothetical protein [Variovorax sp. LG9.2]MEB0060167.1 hypothetical protein [Variovorax sp. LG9.2]